MDLTGAADGPPDVSPARTYALLGTVLHTLEGLTACQGRRVALDPATVLGLRAAWSGYQRAGRRSAGGATRLLRAADGWCAVTLSRPDDIASVPAIVGDDRPGDPWDVLAHATQSMTAADLADRAQLLGVPGAALPVDPARTPIPWRVTRIADPTPPTGLTGKLVVDLTSMWAGPLTARILGSAGAEVVKVESPHRPDGARADARFFDWLHDGHEFRTVDFRSTAGRSELAGLLDRADIVLEASRPRALAQYGLGPEQRTHRPGKVWLSITGYGRTEPMRVAFGDDAAVAGGLVGWAGGGPVFCADAVADPLSGVCGALAVTAAVAAGGGVLLDLSMRDTAAAFAAAPPLDHGPHPVTRTHTGWVVHCANTGDRQPVLPPRASDSPGVLGKNPFSAEGTDHSAGANAGLVPPGGPGSTGAAGPSESSHTCAGERSLDTTPGACSRPAGDSSGDAGGSSGAAGAAPC
ncbi:CoA transferase [Nocardia sp. CA-290969]|uniref:CoA transferase n=1 Tax=Nocardia sp. CA-290969 TaxID=3239986 RepID=UPI003D8B81E9